MDMVMDRETAAVPLIETGMVQEEASVSRISKEQLNKWERKLNEYKAGKASVDQRIQVAEKWWKLRNFETVQAETDAKAGTFRSATAWLHNVIVSKHADAIEAYPAPNFLPREQGDRVEAWALSQIVPVILAQNDYEDTYDEAQWTKLKTGTSCVKVVWDKRKHNGLGDIAISAVDILNLFWQPGIKDIQKSDMVFHVEMVDKEVLTDMYPELKGKGLEASFRPNEQPTDDTVNTADKTAVIDVYYRKSGKLHYCKYVGDNILYSSEDERPEGYYDHGLYPFVFDTLYPVEGSPCGYGFVDVCRNSQTCIDMMDTAILRNTVSVANPRYFMRQDGGINEEEFLNIENPIVHTTGNLGEDSLRVVDARQLSGNYINALTQKINELRETSGNTETSTGATPAGVTAASAIAALQEASNKGSRASTTATYRANKKVYKLVLELIRQFYDQPRQFRILGDMGVQKFLTFDNRFMKPQPQGTIGGVDMGYRTPEYDIEVVPEKKSRYTKLSQNELAKELYALGLYDPRNADQAMLCLEMMDFDSKDELMQKVSQNGMMFSQLMQYKMLAETLMMKHEPQMAAGMMGAPVPGGKPKGRNKEEAKGEHPQEIKQVRDARQRASEGATPGGKVS